MIPYGRQDISQADIDAVVDVLRSDFLTQGPAVPRFESRVAEYVGARHAVAVHSATAALHIACLALGVGPGDRVWTSPITFVASANCALYCGAEIDFVDIDPVTYNLSPNALEARLVEAKREGRLPKVVIPVHLCGQSCDMQAIQKLAREYGFRIIEDASHAIGGRYRQRPVGSCEYSDITVFSFHPVKIITTAEGGMALTNDPGLARRMALLQTHGITRDPREMQREPDGPWYYEQIALGYNYRMTELQAALGVSQMDRIDNFVAVRNNIADRYDRAFAELPLQTPKQHDDARSARHLYVIRVGDGESAAPHRLMFESMRAAGIGVNLHYIPVHLQPYYRTLGFSPGQYPEAERYYRQAISLPLFPTMTEEQIVSVIANVTSVVNN